MIVEIDELWALNRIKTLKKIQSDLEDTAELLKEEISLVEKLGQTQNL